MRYFLAVTLSAMLAAVFQTCAVAASARSEILIGSNFFWYDLDRDQCAAGSAAAARDRFAVVPAYSTPEGRLSIDQTLKSMRQKGQQVIALGLLHQHGGRGNSILDSTGGTLSAEMAANLSALVDTIIDLDFRVLYLRFFPFGENYAPVTGNDTLALKSDLYQENLSFIGSVLKLTRGKSIKIITDLCNECSPSSATFDSKDNRLQARLMVYTRQLWKDYVQQYGPDNTVGFSIIPDKFRVANLPAVYDPGGVRPRMLDFHFYPARTEMKLMECRGKASGSVCEAERACSRSPAAEACHPIFAGSLFDDLAHQLQTIGFQVPWIVGETYYNDLEFATYLRTAMEKTHQQVLYIFQWPLQRANEADKTRDACGDTARGGGVNVGSPVDADAYLKIRNK